MEFGILYQFVAVIPVNKYKTDWRIVVPILYCIVLMVWS